VLLEAKHVLVLVAVLFGALAVRATEVYTDQYQTLPVLDWMESRPPLVQSSQVPAAADLVRGSLGTVPLLTIEDDVRPLLPIFGPPGKDQRTIGGVRDAARIRLGSPGEWPPESRPVEIRLDVIVFNRAMRANAWSHLLAQNMDFRDPENGLFQLRAAGPEETDGVWIAAPKEGGRIATVAGVRGPVGFELQVFCQRLGADSLADQTDLSARAEQIARDSAAAYTAWLEQQLGSAA
jgi:hypothetical protein